MTLQQKINCHNCMVGNHKECQSENCLCLEDQHGQKPYSLKEAGKPPSGPVEPKVYEQALYDKIQLEDYIDNGPGNNSIGYASIEFAKLLVISNHMVSKIEIEKQLNFWCKKYHGDIDDVAIKRISFCLDQLEKASNFENGLDWQSDIVHHCTIEEILGALVSAEQVIGEME